MPRSNPRIITPRSSSASLRDWREDWKYTRTAALEKRAFNSEAADGAVAMDKIEALLLVDSTAPRLVFINGRFFPALSRVDNLPEDVTFSGLSEVLGSNPDVLKGLYGEVSLLDRHPFAALNTAFADDGVYLNIAGGATMEQPLQALFITTAAQDGHVTHPRILVRACNNSQATLVEHHVAIGDAVYPSGHEYFTNIVAEIKLGDNAVLNYYRVQEEGPKAFHVSSVHVHQGRDSRFHSHGVSLGNAVLRNDIDVQLAAIGAHCDLIWPVAANMWTSTPASITCSPTAAVTNSTRASSTAAAAACSTAR